MRGHWCRGCKEWRTQEEFNIAYYNKPNDIRGICKKCGTIRINGIYLKVNLMLHKV